MTSSQSENRHAEENWIQTTAGMWTDPAVDAKTLTSTENGILKNRLTQAMCCDYKYTTPLRLHDRIVQKNSGWTWLGSFVHGDLLEEAETFFSMAEIAELVAQRKIKKRANEVSIPKQGGKAPPRGSGEKREPSPRALYFKQLIEPPSSEVNVPPTEHSLGVLDTMPLDQRHLFVDQVMESVSASGYCRRERSR
jgi:hypothetical protein